MAHIRICRGFGLALGRSPDWDKTDIVFDDGEQIHQYPIRAVWGVIFRKVIVGAIVTERLDNRGAVIASKARSFGR
jgi:hypothetical protein